MKSFFLTALTLACNLLWAGQAEFPKEFVGIWGDVRVGCEVYPIDSDAGFKIERYKFLGYEKSCKVASVSRQRSQSITAKLTCDGEGETYDTEMTLSLSSDGRILTSGEIKYIRCKNNN